MQKVLLNTNKGKIVLELWRDKAPVTVDNFIKYVESKFFDGLIFHRVIDNFMIQGGGFTAEGHHKEGQNPIVNEANNGLENKIGTIAMARTNDPHSATSQFFINVADNDFLNYQNKSNWGYCVFGQVIEGIEVVNEIKKIPTGVNPITYMSDWPQEDIIILNAEIV